MKSKIQPFFLKVGFRRNIVMFIISAMFLLVPNKMLNVACNLHPSMVSFPFVFSINKGEVDGISDPSEQLLKIYNKQYNLIIYHTHFVFVSNQKTASEASFICACFNHNTQSCNKKNIQKFIWVRSTAQKDFKQ